MDSTDYRARIGSIPARFPETSIDLATTSTSELAAFYEPGLWLIGGIIAIVIVIGLGVLLLIRHIAD